MGHPNLRYLIYQKLSQAGNNVTTDLELLNALEKEDGSVKVSESRFNKALLDLEIIRID
jgi:hypothetical protein